MAKSSRVAERHDSLGMLDGLDMLVYSSSTQFLEVKAICVKPKKGSNKRARFVALAGQCNAFVSVGGRAGRPRSIYGGETWWMFEFGRGWST